MPEVRGKDLMPVGGSHMAHLYEGKETGAAGDGRLGLCALQTQHFLQGPS